MPYTRPKLGRQLHPGRPHRHAIEVSDPVLDRSDETSVAINPRNPRNIVAGAASFNGTQFINTAYVTKDRGLTWKTVTVLTNTDEGAGIAFDDSGNCYYTTMQGGFFPVCVVSQDGGMTWSQPAAFGFGDDLLALLHGDLVAVDQQPVFSGPQIRFAYLGGLRDVNRLANGLRKHRHCKRNHGQQCGTSNKRIGFHACQPFHRDRVSRKTTCCKARRG